MAIRNIRIENDSILRKISKPVEKFDKKLHDLLDDMKETMYEAEGVGLAGVQVGILRRVIVIDMSDDGSGLLEIINPEVLENEGEQVFEEACLSIKGKSGLVTRPYMTKIKAQNRFGEPFELVCEGHLGVCINHEIDHLNGILFTDIATEIFTGSDEELREQRLARRQQMEQKND